ncbi:MAG: YcaQ family DNA glycosylase [Anaerolineae bacterium]|nr:YcaQ family DNA glycosylase [Anaerolineae bacterium]
MTQRTITKTTARRLAIARQRLAGTPPPATAESILDVVRDLGCLQLDPISAVARSHQLVLWSRLGQYKLADLDRLIYADRHLFEYWAHVASIVLTEDYPIHHWRMRNYVNGDGDDPWSLRVRDWIEQNRDLHDFILAELTEKGAMLSRELELDGVDPKHWVSSGWTSGRNVSRMLDFLWSQGRIMVAGRSGVQKKWDLAERCLPEWTPRDQWESDQVVAYAAQKSLRALGVGTIQHIKLHYTRGRYPDLARVLTELEKQGRVARVGIEGVSGTYYIHADDLLLLDRIEAGDWEPRTTLLSPFDNLICDRKRTETLWDFYFRIEIYVPADKRQYGYYVLPILHGDQLIGRIDPTFERKTRTLRVSNIYAEPGAPADAAPAIRASIKSLAGFLGAKQIEYGEVANVWRRKIR